MARRGGVVKILDHTTPSARMKLATFLDRAATLLLLRRPIAATFKALRQFSQQCLSRRGDAGERLIPKYMNA